MNDIAISVKNLSKKYKLYDSPKHRLKEALHPFRKKYHRDFWALRDVSFEVKKGETIGIIGKNGSGKSTLLQLICGILQPTDGEVAVNGRISSLLELGAGFNPEFTGRQNVYMNGALMGFTKKEMDQRFDAIADFADIGEFIDQPVKTYSSGMYVRLAFAAAINVDPDILLVDEALAVGDIRFQQKCFRRMFAFREEGKTILMVTHDTTVVTRFCNRTTWLHDGRIRQSGAPEEVVKSYFSYMVYDAVTTDAKESSGLKDKGPRLSSEVVWEDVTRCTSFGEGGAVIKRTTLYDSQRSKKTNLLSGGELVVLMLDIEIVNNIDSPIAGFVLNDRYGNSIIGTNSHLIGNELPPLKQGDKVTVEFAFRFPRLKNGEYLFAVAIAEGTQHAHVQHHWIHDAYVIRVAGKDEAATMGWYLLVDDMSMKVDITNKHADNER